jgi:iron complex transport system ATP-binding protein
LAGLYADRLTLLDHGLVVAAGPAAAVLRPDTLRTFYGADVTVHHADDGTVVVIPRRSDVAPVLAGPAVRTVRTVREAS